MDATFCALSCHFRICAQGLYIIITYIYIYIYIYIIYIYIQNINILYFVYKPRIRFIFLNIKYKCSAIGPLCMLRRCGFQNSGLTSNRYESPLLFISYISWFIDLYALYTLANSEVSCITLRLLAPG